MPISSSGWTLIVVAEDGLDSNWCIRCCNATRYAFVKRDAATGELIACGLGDFFPRVTGRDESVEAEAGAERYVPPTIGHLVSERKPDKIDEIVGPLTEKRARLVKEELDKRAAAEAKHAAGLQEQERSAAEANNG